ncbi:MAG: 4'-phosphopantetheinyl transferase superfamily protein [Anaerovoracaceae bacterium]
MPTILRTAEGKPYFEDLPIHFSISHTGTLWLCIMGNSPVGIDIQRIKPLGMDRVAKRFFTPEEQDYISQTGEAGFFSVWCRKEAYTKYFGSTLATEISKVNMVSEGQLLTEINGIYLTDCPITEDTHCTVAKGTKEEIWINILD